MSFKAIVTAGGTAGHINPAIAIAKQITAHGGQVLFIGKEGGMETDLVAKEGFNISCIKVAGFKRSLSPSNLKTVFLAAKGLSDTRRIIKDFAPDIVIGCGGYVSGPAVFSAAMMKIPTLIHEQNVFPGMTTKILSRVVDRICVSFEESIKYLPGKKKAVLTGNPVREGILSVSPALARDELKISQPILLVFGGSLGAKKINDTMLELIKTKKPDFGIIWGTGKRYYEDIMKELEGAEIGDNITVTPYIYNMDTVMAASDIVVSRAGAIAISEICAMGKCSVLIPSPYVTNNHQEHNAAALEAAGASVMLGENELNAGLLFDTVSQLFSDSKKADLIRANALKMAKPSASKDIYEEVLVLTRH
ncbi:MAG: undecaprenyldiphospho-muramoylpentapeptide beta-N-acetylglucosaminyltransferase [Clostridia bacterium]|nr:undecaprenyldiphospho-muramoylpentapeptide beta-N-acetylglucosaminyltransferase [Clostridia bacterium]